MGIGDDKNVARGAGEGHARGDGDERSDGEDAGVLKILKGITEPKPATTSFVMGGSGGGDGLVAAAAAAAADDDDDVLHRDALRRHVCHVLGVDATTEGEALVPSAGVGSAVTRIDWTRVSAIADESDAQMASASASVAGLSTQSYDEGTIGDGDDSRGHSASAAGGGSTTQPMDANTTAAESTTATAAAPPASGTTAAAPSADLTSQLFAGALSCDAEYRAAYKSAPGRIGPPRVEVDRSHMAGDVRLDDTAWPSQTLVAFFQLKNFKPVVAGCRRSLVVAGCCQ